jgi:hypothetical protein
MQPDSKERMQARRSIKPGQRLSAEAGEWPVAPTMWQIVWLPGAKEWIQAELERVSGSYDPEEIAAALREVAASPVIYHLATLSTTVLLSASCLPSELIWHFHDSLSATRFKRAAEFYIQVWRQAA